MKESKKSATDLTETIHSLLGLKARLTPNWVDSVCHIVKSLHSRGPRAGFEPAEPDSGPRSLSAAEEAEKGSVTSKLKDEIDALHSRINELSLQRRQVLNEYLDLKGNIRVFCRIRPIGTGENLGHSRPVASPDSSRVLLEVAGSNRRSYSFDKVFHPSSSQDEVFKEVEPVTKSALDGYNASIFAYGQTGTGKTFTMEGNLENPGVVPRTIKALFNQASDSNYKYRLSFSMLEIYLGSLKDLLVPQPVQPADPMPPRLVIQTDPNGGISIENLVAIPVSDHIQALRLYRLGCRFRSTASTNSNLTSSRSHCLIRISITCFDAPERRRATNKVWLIDLGGSERVLKTKASGRRLEEGKAINLSLSALGDVIYALQRKRAHIPFRNSKLTEVLKDSLGEDSKTLMLVHVSSKEEDLCETICTLNFAARARSIRLGNEDPAERTTKEVAMENLQETITRIEHERQKMREDMEKLKGKLHSLTRTDPFCCDDEYFSSGAPLVNPDITRNKIKDAEAVPSSKVPRFMKPTVCSRTKSGTSQLIFDEKKFLQTKRRRAPSHRAKSVTFPMRCGSQQNSDRSISGASCLAGLNLKGSVDVETEQSIDASECDVKMVVFSEEKKPPSTDYSTQHLKVDKWLKSRESRSAAGVSRNRRIPAIPLPLKLKADEEDMAENLTKKVHAEDFKTADTDKGYNKEEVVADEVDSSSSTVEVEMDKAQMIPNNSLMSADEIRDTEAWFDASFIMPDQNCLHNEGDDIPCGKLSRESTDFDENEMQALQIPKELICNCGGLEEEFSASNSSWTSKPDYQEMLLGTDMEDREEDASFDMFKIRRRRNPLDLKHRRALFAGRTNRKDTSVDEPNIRSDANIQTAGTSSGTYHTVGEKVQTMCAGALLGLQLQSIGFGDDFFDGLIL